MTNLERWRQWTRHLFSPDSFVNFGWYYVVAAALQRRRTAIGEDAFPALQHGLDAAERRPAGVQAEAGPRCHPEPAHGGRVGGVEGGIEGLVGEEQHLAVGHRPLVSSRWTAG